MLLKLFFKRERENVRVIEKDREKEREGERYIVGERYRG